MNRTLIRCAALVALTCCPPAFSVEEGALAELLENARDEMNLPGLRAVVRFPDGRIV